MGLTGVGRHSDDESGAGAGDGYGGDPENKGGSEGLLANSDGGERPWQRRSLRKGGVAAGRRRCGRLRWSRDEDVNPRSFSLLQRSP
jgi:hypothetical protein